MNLPSVTHVNTEGNTVPPVTETTTNTPPAAASPPAATAEQPTTQSNGKVISMPTGAMAKIKQQERERGRRGALKELDQTAQALGWKDFEDMKRNAKRTKGEAPAPRPEQRQAAPQPQSPKPSQPRSTDQRVTQLQEERRKALRSRAQVEKRLKQIEHEKLAMEAEMELKIAAVRCGVKDVDYAVALIKRETQSMSSGQLDQFDEQRFFADTLRKSHPYLYGETVVPANTSAPTEGQGAPPPPASPPVAKDGEGKPGVVDANKLTRDEFDKLLRSRGLGGALSGAAPA